MKKIIFLFSYFIIINVASQCIYVKDKNTKEVLPYASIQFTGKNKGLYTNERGEISLKHIRNNDSIVISYLGYHSLKLKITSTLDTIYLKPKIEILSEIVISVGSPKKEKIGFVNSRKKLRWHLRTKQELATLIVYKHKFKKAIINKIFVPISKSTIEAGKKNEKLDVFYPNFSSVFKVNIYNNKNNTPGKLIISNPIYIKCNQDSPKKIEINLKNNQVSFPQEGVFISVEVIQSEIYNEEKKHKLDSLSTLPSFRLTNKTKKNINATTYTRGVFLENNYWVRLKDSNSYLSNYNLALSLELYIYD